MGLIAAIDAKFCIDVRANQPQNKTGNKSIS